MLQELCGVWEDRIAAIISIPVVLGRTISSHSAVQNNTAELDLVEVMSRFHRAKDSLEGGCSLDLELVVQDVTSWEDPALHQYPINAARNRALQLSRGELLLLLDVDFLPSASLLAGFRGTRDELAYLHTQKIALVIPTFGHADYHPTASGVDARWDPLLLTSKSLVVGAYIDGTMPSFYMVENPADHGPTNFTRWMQATAPYSIEYEQGFEPYVIVARRHVPWFDERFFGYYRNKVSHLELMYGQGVSYMVHPTAYVLHRPHLKSATFQASQALNGSVEHFNRMVRLHSVIRDEMSNGTYVPVTSFGHRCPPSELKMPLRLALAVDKRKWARARLSSTLQFDKIERVGQ